MIQVLQSVDLFFIEVVHFMWSDRSILVQIDNFIPVLQRSQRSLILLWKHEPYEVFIAHLALLAWLKLAGNLVENTINCFTRKSVSLVPREVLLINQEVVICIKLPESAIKNVEVLIAKVGSHFVDVFLVTDNLKHIEEVWLLEVSESYVTVIICIQLIEYPHDDRVSISLLKLWRLL